LGNVQVEVLAYVASPDLRALAEAGQRLPWRQWLIGP
jgi:hypothetical protein